MNCFPHLDNTNQIFFFFFLPVWPGRLAMAVVPTLELHSDFTTIEVIAKHLFHQERQLHCRSLFTLSGSDGKKNNRQLQHSC